MSAHERPLDGPQTMPSEPDGWWETQRAQFVNARVVELTGAGQRIADVGCGRASLLEDLPSDREVVRVDSHVWQEWQHRPGIFVCASAAALPFRDGAFDLVGSFDVLEHLADDTAALREQARVCRPGGRVVAAVPADPRLWSVHDERVGHVRRYTTRALGALGRRADLALDRASHFFSYLWLPARLTRRSTVRTAEPSLGSGWINALVDAVIGVLARLERAWLRRASIPFGTSIWAEWKR